MITSYQVNPPEIKANIDSILSLETEGKLLDWEENRVVPFHLIDTLGKKGLLHACVLDSDYVRNKAILAESVGRISLGLSCTILNTINIPVTILKHHGNDFLKDTFLMPTLNGDKIGAIAINEKDSGSDLLGLKTTLQKVSNDEYSLKGHKHFILNIPGADYIVTLARSSEVPSSSMFKYCLVVVPTDLPGIKVETIATNCLRTAAIGNITFDNCLISSEYIIGHPNKGILYLEPALSEERLFGCVALMASVRKIIEDLFEFVGLRELQGTKLGALQAVRHELADLASEYEITNAYLQEILSNWDFKNKEFIKKIPMLKLLCAEKSQSIVERAIQLYGGRGFLNEFDISRTYQDICAASSFAGTSEMMKELISEKILKRGRL